MIGVRRTLEPSAVQQHVRQMLLLLRDHPSPNTVDLSCRWGVK